MRYLFLFGNVVLLAAGQMLFKAAADQQATDRWSFLFSTPYLLAIAIYATATVAWVFTLRVWPISVAYPTQALATAIVLVLSVRLFGETLSTMQMVGISAIIAGVMLLAFK